MQLLWWSNSGRRPGAWQYWLSTAAFVLRSFCGLREHCVVCILWEPSLDWKTFSPWPKQSTGCNSVMRCSHTGASCKSTLQQAQVQLARCAVRRNSAQIAKAGQVFVQALRVPAALLLVLSRLAHLKLSCLGVYCFIVLALGSKRGRSVCQVVVPFKWWGVGLRHLTADV